MTASHTGQFKLDNVFVSEEWLIAGPVENVMSAGSGAGTGGLGTSTLALGLAKAAIDFISAEASKRPELLPPRDGLLRVVGHDGDNFLGGRDFDWAVLDHVIAETARVNDVSVASGRVVTVLQISSTSLFRRTPSPEQAAPS